jgi:hypothetical protein
VRFPGPLPALDLATSMAAWSISCNHYIWGVRGCHSTTASVLTTKAKECPCGRGGLNAARAATTTERRATITAIRAPPGCRPSPQAVGRTTAVLTSAGPAGPSRARRCQQDGCGAEARYCTPTTWPRRLIGRGARPAATRGSPRHGRRASVAGAQPHPQRATATQRCPIVLTVRGSLRPS